MIHLVLIILMGLASAQDKPNALEDPWCVDKPVVISKKYLQCLQSFEITKSLRQTLNDISQNNKNPPKIRLHEVSKERVLSLLAKPFVVVAVGYSGVSGYDVTFVFKEEISLGLVAWMTYNEDDTFNLEMILEEAPPKKYAKLTKRLLKKEYLQYWR